MIRKRNVPIVIHGTTERNFASRRVSLIPNIVCITWVRVAKVFVRLSQISELRKRTCSKVARGWSEVGASPRDDLLDRFCILGNWICRLSSIRERYVGLRPPRRHKGLARVCASQLTSSVSYRFRNTMIQISQFIFFTKLIYESYFLKTHIQQS